MAKKKKCRRAGKVKFDTHERALRRAGELLALPRAPKTLRAYQCRHCGKWHLTKQ